MTTKQIIRLNASALKDSSCLLRLYLTTISGYSSKLNSSDIEYGSAVHKFIQSLSISQGDFIKSVALAQKYFKNTPMTVKTKKDWLNEFHLTQTCHSYYEKVFKNPDNSFQILTDNTGIPLVEQTFSIPYYQDEDVEVLIEGTIDSNGKISGGCYCIQDYKTTSSWNHQEYFEQYELSPQLLLYKWAIEWYAINGVNNNIYQKMIEKGLGCRVMGIFLSPNKETEFEASRVIFFSEDQMNEFKINLDFIIQRLLCYVKDGDIPSREGMLNGACKTEFGLCKFFSACKMPNKDGFNDMLKGHFKQETYLPLKEK